MESDAALLRPYRLARDAGAFQELVRRYAGYVYGVCLRVTGKPTPRGARQRMWQVRQRRVLDSGPPS